MRYLGLDVGEKSIGVASGEVLAEELTTLRSEKEWNFYEEKGLAFACEKLQDLAKKEMAKSVVIGLPVNQEGGMTKESTLIKTFGEGLASTIGMPVIYVNETLTTFMAEDILESQGLSIKEAKLRVDQLSAQLILQQYLEENALA